MRTLNSLAIAILTSFVAISATWAADEASVSGVLLNKHQQTVADTDMDPKATTVGQFFHDYPRGAPGRVPMVPTKEVVTLKVRKANGVQVEIVQDLEDSKDLAVGDKVSIEQVDGKDRVVTAQ
ncbi:MAG TPA: hypothetical protein VK832_04420 [Burkholderiaceae bacterium]|jgi:hypothetical protein|nr:hypothetical protein [Burkholderiaceae bacterium]